MKSVKLFFLMLLCATQILSANRNAATLGEPLVHPIDKILPTLLRNACENGRVKEIASLLSKYAFSAAGQKISYTKSELEAMGYYVDPQCDIATARHIVTVEEVMNPGDCNAKNSYYALTATSRAQGSTKLS
ncbi:hypothetical protein JST99_05105 [Candidatus Dependentiae bacterium]|nr:hypothetical protein [Candidatus Dependentiae bacterium]MCC7415294.1 hypothetical protein [Campylobacterota bacterium]